MSWIFQTTALVLRMTQQLSWDNKIILRFISHDCARVQQPAITIIPYNKISLRPTEFKKHKTSVEMIFGNQTHRFDVDRAKGRELDSSFKAIGCFPKRINIEPKRFQWMYWWHSFAPWYVLAFSPSKPILNQKGVLLFKARMIRRISMLKKKRMLSVQQPTITMSARQ